MKRHQKRHEVPVNWPISRKGTTFVVRKTGKGIPILVVLRDILKLAQNKREVKKALNKGDILISGKKAINERKSIELFDTITIIPAKKHYRLTLSEHGKYDVEEISEKDSKIKIAKVIGKKLIKGNKAQLNLHDGRNCFSDIKCSVNDSVILDIKKNFISKVLPVKEKASVLVTGGKHVGAKGTIIKLIPEYKMAEIKTENMTFNVLIKQLVILK